MSKNSKKKILTLMTILLSASLGIIVSVIGYLSWWYLWIMLAAFLFMSHFRTSNFWLVIGSFIINIYIFMLQYSQKYGIEVIRFGSSYIIVLMVFSILMIAIYTVLGVISWKKTEEIW